MKIIILLILLFLSGCFSEQKIKKEIDPMVPINKSPVKFFQQK